MASAFAMIMGGGASESLSILTETRAEPAVPFGGKFRLIDFPLSNCVNSEIYNVAILTQYRPFSLNNHIGIGKAWDLDRIAASYDSLIDYFNSVRPKGRSSVFAADLELLNVMMRLPSIDPGLPGVLLPKDWPGRRAVSLFRKLRTRWRDQAHSFWDDLLKAE